MSLSALGRIGPEEGGRPGLLFSGGAINSESLLFPFFVTRIVCLCGVSRLYERLLVAVGCGPNSVRARVRFLLRFG